jgi:Ca-activated chloride channel homolog
MRYLKPSVVASIVLLFMAVGHAQQQQQQQQQGAAQPPQDERQAFRFRTAVELINVTATVTDGTGRFVSGLRKEDFRVYEDDQPQTITHFSSERVPVSLGIVLDTSGSMQGEKMVAARRALDRFLLELLGPEDEVFLYRFDSTPELVHGWTTDRRLISRELAQLGARGGTALYDAVAEAIPLAQSGKHRKKALVIISDGNDQNSQTAVRALQAQIRETEVLVYAIGIDTQLETEASPWRPWRGMLDALTQSRPQPFPFPLPGKRNPPRPTPPTTNPGPRGPAAPAPPPPIVAPRNAPSRTSGSDRVNVAALRDITDDSGGRTEVIRSVRDLEPATAYIADELSKQYYMGYAASGSKDGRWHSIRVEVRDGRYLVRARKGFVATP